MIDVCRGKGKRAGGCGGEGGGGGARGQCTLTGNRGEELEVGLTERKEVAVVEGVAGCCGSAKPTFN